MSSTTQYIAIDEEGFPLLGELRVKDPMIAAEILNNVHFAENNAFQTSYQDQKALVEAFDEPFVAQQILKIETLTPIGWRILLPYGVEQAFDPKTLSLDEWDRFHGLTTKGIPFVMSRQAQAEFFNLVDEYSDDSITISGEEITLPPWLDSRPDVHTEKYWSQIYQTEEPGWELNQPTPALIDMLPRLKLPKSRVLVLGCGSGNDAAFFAEQGHVVTAVDISPEALSRGKSKYGHLNIHWLEADIFKLGNDHTQSYDIVFEHTCHCAINPSLRPKLVETWRRLLAPGGYLLGVFFAMEKKQGPPFGGTEWELRERLKKYFHFVFWGRWHQSIQRRDGKEFLVYAQKK